MTADPSGIPRDVDWRELIAMTPVQFEAHCDQLQAYTSKILYDGDLETAAELKAAGWTPEPVTPHSPLMSWYWRRPGKRAGRPGRLFLSPTMALNALRKRQGPSGARG